MDHPPRARAISTLIVPHVRRPGFTARIHSVFHGALNFVAGEQLFTLATAERGLLPNGVTLDTGDDFLARGLKPGMLLRSTNAHLRCADFPFQVDLTGAICWSPLLTPAGVFRPLESAIAVLAGVLANSAAQAGFGPLLSHLAAPTESALPELCRVAQPVIADLLQGLRTDRLAQTIEASAGLIGLGDGLTPSGDDFLVGVCAALVATDHWLARPFSAACASHARGRTTRISEMFLDYAAQGAYAARVHELVAALHAEVADHCLARALTATLGWGGTSGSDCLLGVLCGVGLPSAATLPATSVNSVAGDREREVSRSRSASMQPPRTGVVWGRVDGPPRQREAGVGDAARKEVILMFARITWSTIPEARIEPGVVAYREQVVPSLRTRAGFLGTVLLVDRAGGQAASATYWDSAANMGASEEMGVAARTQIARLADTRVVDIDRFEVAVQDRVVPVQERGFVRVNDLSCDPGQIDDTVEFIRQRAVPILRGLSGYRAMLIAVNRQTGRMLVSSAWNSAAEREASDDHLRDLRRQAADMARATSVRISLLEVALAEVQEAAQRSTTEVRVTA